MIADIFKAVLVMSAASSCVAMILFVLRRVCSSLLSYNMHYRAWLAVIVIAMMPLSFVIHSNTSESTGFTQNIHTFQHKLTYAEPVQMTSDVSEFAASSIDLSVMDVISLMWMIVAVGKFAGVFYNYFQFLKKTFGRAKFSHKIGKISVYEADILSAPIAVGIFKKRIILPTGISDKMRNIIEMHECVHFKHNDIPFKWLVAVVRCVHWFNPIFGFVSKAVDEDCEIYCDMTVCRDMDDVEKKYYMNTILSLISSASKCPVYTAMANSKQNIIRRFSYISNQSGRVGFVRMFAGVAVLTAVFVFATILSGIAGGRVYDGSFPAIRLNFFAVNMHTPQNMMPTVRTEIDNTIPFSNNKVMGENKTDKSDIRKDLPSENQNNISYEHTAEVRQIPENNTDKYYSAPVLDDLDEYKSIVPETSEKETVLPSVNTGLSDDSADVFSQKGEEEKVKSDYESDEFRYPYSGSVKYDGLTLDAIENDIEQNGGKKSSPDGVDLKTGYVSDKLSYLNDGVSQIKNVTTDSNGQVSFYMNSEYDQHIEVSIEQNGKQVAGYGIIPDNETTYVFGGLNPDETYDITISSSTGGSWKIENDYIIY